MAAPTSIRVKMTRSMMALLAVIGAATLLLVAAMSYASSRATLSTIESHLRAQIQRKGKELVASQALALRDLVADNAFGDVGRLLDRTTAMDEQVLYGLFLDEELKPWRYAVSTGRSDSLGIPGDWRMLGIDSERDRRGEIAETRRLIAGRTMFEFAAPVVDDKGRFLGSLRYGISDRALQEALRSARSASRRAQFTAALFLVLLIFGTTAAGMLLATRAASRMTQPLSNLTTAVNALARGQRDIRVSIRSGDEIEQLGTAFNVMAKELQESYAQLEQMNRVLEAKVVDRTRELGERNRDMRLVLDNVEQGFLTVSAEGMLAIERSAMVDRWFGAYGADTFFTAYMARFDPGYSEYFAVGLEALQENTMPVELCLAQLPTRLHHGGREFRCNYLPLGAESPPAGLLIVIRDVTPEIDAARRDAEREEILSIFEGLTRDRAGFLAFIDETGHQIARLLTAPLDTQKNLLHTVKGNCHVMGLGVVAGLCHSLEDQLLDTGACASEEALAVMRDRWQALMTALDGFLGVSGRDVVEVRTEEIDAVIAAVGANASANELLDRLASWRLEPADRPLQRLAGHARALATRLGKGGLEVVVDGGGVYLSPKDWAGVWSDLSHVVRNAVDHGIEPTETRLLAGKPATPVLRLTARIAAGGLVVEIADDGAGIDWSAVRRAAEGLGLPTAGQDDLVRAIFASAVTTREETTETSGRGIGLAAVRQQVENRGGEVSLESRPGLGTCFRFTFPLPDIGPRFGISGSHTDRAA